jgi:hypothetical protein
MNAMISVLSSSGDKLFSEGTCRDRPGMEVSFVSTGRESKGREVERKATGWALRCRRGRGNLLPEGLDLRVFFYRRGRGKLLYREVQEEGDRDGR